MMDMRLLAKLEFSVVGKYIDKKSKKKVPKKILKSEENNKGKIDSLHNKDTNVSGSPKIDAIQKTIDDMSRPEVQNVKGSENKLLNTLINLTSIQEFYEDELIEPTENKDNDATSNEVDDLSESYIPAGSSHHNDVIDPNNTEQCEEMEETKFQQPIMDEEEIIENINESIPEVQMKTETIQVEVEDTQIQQETPTENTPAQAEDSNVIETDDFPTEFTENSRVVAETDLNLLQSNLPEKNNLNDESNNADPVNEDKSETTILQKNDEINSQHEKAKIDAEKNIVEKVEKTADVDTINSNDVKIESIPEEQMSHIITETNQVEIEDIIIQQNTPIEKTVKQIEVSSTIGEATISQEGTPIDSYVIESDAFPTEFTENSRVVAETDPNLLQSNIPERKNLNDESNNADSDKSETTLLQKELISHHEENVKKESEKNIVEKLEKTIEVDTNKSNDVLIDYGVKESTTAYTTIDLNVEQNDVVDPNKSTSLSDDKIPEVQKLTHSHEASLELLQSPTRIDDTQFISNLTRNDVVGSVKKKECSGMEELTAEEVAALFENPNSSPSDNLDSSLIAVANLEQNDLIDPNKSKRIDETESQQTKLNEEEIIESVNESNPEEQISHIMTETNQIEIKDTKIQQSTPIIKTVEQIEVSSTISEATEIQEEIPTENTPAKAEDSYVIKIDDFPNESTENSRVVAATDSQKNNEVISQNEENAKVDSTKNIVVKLEKTTEFDTNKSNDVLIDSGVKDSTTTYTTIDLKGNSQSDEKKPEVQKLTHSHEASLELLQSSTRNDDRQFIPNLTRTDLEGSIKVKDCSGMEELTEEEVAALFENPNSSSSDNLDSSLIAVANLEQNDLIDPNKSKRIDETESQQTIINEEEIIESVDESNPEEQMSHIITETNQVEIEDIIIQQNTPIETTVEQIEVSSTTSEATTVIENPRREIHDSSDDLIEDDSQTAAGSDSASKLTEVVAEVLERVNEMPQTTIPQPNENLQASNIASVSNVVITEQIIQELSSFEQCKRIVLEKLDIPLNFQAAYVPATEDLNIDEVLRNCKKIRFKKKTSNSKTVGSANANKIDFGSIGSNPIAALYSIKLRINEMNKFFDFNASSEQPSIGITGPFVHYDKSKDHYDDFDNLTFEAKNQLLFLFDFIIDMVRDENKLDNLHKYIYDFAKAMATEEGQYDNKYKRLRDVFILYTEGKLIIPPSIKFVCEILEDVENIKESYDQISLDPFREMSEDEFKQISESFKYYENDPNETKTKLQQAGCVKLIRFVKKFFTQYTLFYKATIFAAFKQTGELHGNSLCNIYDRLAHSYKIRTKFLFDHLIKILAKLIKLKGFNSKEIYDFLDLYQDFFVPIREIHDSDLIANKEKLSRIITALLKCHIKQYINTDAEIKVHNDIAQICKKAADDKKKDYEKQNL